MSEKKPFRVILWCVPRSVSSALTKCISFFDNTQIWFEPFAANFMTSATLGDMGLEMPDNEGEFDQLFSKIVEMLKGTPLEGSIGPELLDKSILGYKKVRENLASLPADVNVFVKDMAFAVTGNYSSIPGRESGFRHAFIIRDPERMFPSWRNLLLNMAQTGPVRSPVVADTFDFTKDVSFVMPGFTYKCQYDLWNYVKANFDPDPVVIDSDEMLTKPAAILPKFCAALGMPWAHEYLSWDHSPEVVREWRCPMVLDPSVDYGIAAFHKMAFNSGQFSPSKPKITRSRMTPDVTQAIEDTVGYYQEMYATRITG